MREEGQQGERIKEGDEEKEESTHVWDKICTHLQCYYEEQLSSWI